jgi:putative endonuclease
MADAIYSVYVLKNPAGRFYIGVTDNVCRRVIQHNSGISNWTRGKGPWALVFEKNGMNLSAARKFEIELKRQKGGDGFFRVTGLGRSRNP